MAFDSSNDDFKQLELDDDYLKYSSPQRDPDSMQNLSLFFSDPRQFESEKGGRGAAKTQTTAYEPLVMLKNMKSEVEQLVGPLVKRCEEEPTMRKYDMFSALKEEEEEVGWKKGKENKGDHFMNVDTYGIDKWEEANKEAENELESLEFSVNREEGSPYVESIDQNSATFTKPQESQENSQQMINDSFADKNIFSEQLEESKEEKRTHRNEDIEKIKGLITNQSQLKKFDTLYNKPTASSIRKKKYFVEEFKDGRCTFRPQVDKMSEALANASFIRNDSVLHNSVEVGDRLYQRAKTSMAEKQQKQLSHQKSKDEHEVEQCTFQPHLAPSRKLYTKVVEGSSLYDRSRQWEMNKQTKLQREKESKAGQEFEGCTFKPNIKMLTQKRAVSRNGETGQVMTFTGNKGFQQSMEAKPYNSARGVNQERSIQQFINRQKKAQQEKKEKEDKVQKCNGSKWERKPTHPVAFKFYNNVTHKREEFDAQMFFKKEGAIKQKLEKKAFAEKTQPSIAVVSATEYSSNSKQNFYGMVDLLHQELHNIQFEEAELQRP